jgi:hypothetical protein
MTCTFLLETADGAPADAPTLLTVEPRKLPMAELDTLLAGWDARPVAQGAKGGEKERPCGESQSSVLAWR